MEYLYAFLGGAFGKIYDDFHDNKIITNRVALESLKGVQWITLALLSYNDFNFTIFNYIINVGNALGNWESWDFPYETSLLIVYPFFLLTSYSTRAYLTFYDCIHITIVFAAMVADPLFIKEEYSYRKLFLRLMAAAVSLMFILFMFFIESHHSIHFSLFVKKLAFMGLGYNLLSSCFQAYMLFK